jgi:hypothetical protein
MGKPMNRLKGMTINDDLKAGEEVRGIKVIYHKADLISLSAL